ncbi:YihY/virulence factor BrkB family protein [Hazenella coriacea]|uniref:Membrane protein n=1 Tax=Hazenella coriacea TaxID=1179467 RepID=A0A4R3LCI9_9BACL|nr:YihY/virulence factor BrkB family protein [Hazenella coriacea]TCS97000.1 membrane protein [Hazenella coriacea]
MIKPFFFEFIRRLKEQQIFDLSAQLAYYFLMSIFPFLLLAVTLLGYLPISSKDILQFVRPYAPEDTYLLLASNLATILDEQRGGILSFSIIATTYLASAGFQSIVRIMDTAYEVEEDRPFWKEAVLGFFLMLGILLALIISLVLPVFGKMIGSYLFALLGLTDGTFTLLNWIRWILSSGVLLIAFISLYKFSPNIKVKFRQVLPGSLFATIGWQLSSLGFAYYVSPTRYSHIYGNLGGLIVLMIWFYLTAMILILGALINATLSKVRSKSMS